MTYVQITSGERYMLAALRTQDISQAEMARALGRHPSSISREFKRNCCLYDGAYRPSKAQERTGGRRSRSRRNQRLSSGTWRLVRKYLRLEWSPEQIAAWLHARLAIRISHERIYQYIWRDKRSGGSLWRSLRGAQKKRRKRYGAYDSRGRLAGKRHISERPQAANLRSEPGHWEIDTVVGPPGASKDCIMSLVERKTGFTLIGKLPDRTSTAMADRAIEIIQASCMVFKTITADNGSEFHDYARIEEKTGARFYFATPHHSWERGTCENTNGLIRQYIPKRTDMAGLSQQRCNHIAMRLNTRPRKRHQFKTPIEAYNACF